MEQESSETTSEVKALVKKAMKLEKDIEEAIHPQLRKRGPTST